VEASGTESLHCGGSKGTARWVVVNSSHPPEGREAERAERLASVCNPSSDTCLQSVKSRLLRASNHNFKNSYYHNKSTQHKLGETNNKLNTQ
jgi:hypothetical protein